MPSGMDSPSQVSVKHRAEDIEKSLFVLLMSIRSSNLFDREWTFTRCNNGSGIQKHRCCSLTSSVPVCFPRLRLLQAPQRAAAPLIKISEKVSRFVKTGEKVFGLNC